MKYLGSISDSKSHVTKEYVDDAIDKKADKDGVYPDMTVGMTRDMLGVGEGDEGEFLFRPTDGDGSIKDGFASIEKIEGNSVVWNNMIDTRDYEGSFYKKIVKILQGHKYLLQRSAANGGLYLIPTINGEQHYEMSLRDGEYAKIVTSMYTALDDASVYAEQYCGACVIADLTQMFGAGFEPSTIEEFYQRIPKGIDINAYNEGEVVNMNVEGIKSVGFNAWDEEWEMGYIDASNGNTIYALNHICAKNKIHILPNTTYYLAKPAGAYTIIAYYDINGLYIGQQDAFATSGIGGTFKTFENAHYMRFFCDIPEYNNDICIHLVHTGYRNGEYEPHVSDEIALPIADYFPNGMNSIGSVKDEINAAEAIQRIGVVDLGTLNWAVYESGKSIFQSEYLIGKAQYPQYDSFPAELVCARYVTKKWYDGGNGDGVYQTENGIGLEQAGMLYVADTSFTDAASFKAAMSGVMLYYELAEPIVTSIDMPLALDYQVWDFGTEEAIAEGKTTPLKASIIYEFNARDTIRANKLALKNKADKTELNSLDERVTALEEEEGSSVTVDTELSETSENAISNSAVTRAMVENEEVTAAALNELNERVNEISENVSGGAVTKEEFEEAIKTLSDADVAINEAISEVDEKVSSLETTVADTYATKAELEENVDTINGAIDTLQKEVIDNEEVVAAALNDLDVRVKEVSANVSGETATKVELQDAVTSLTNTILENEEVHAAALNDLNTRLNEILTRLNNAGI